MELPITPETTTNKSDTNYDYVKGNFKYKYESESDFFLNYPYKKQDPICTRPYIKQKDRVENDSLSLTFQEFRILLSIYVKYFKLFLLSGNRIKLPHRLGEMMFSKYKYKNRLKIDLAHYKKTGEHKWFKNSHTLGYGPIFLWNKYSAALSNKHLYGAKLSRTFMKEMSDEFFSNPSLLLSYEDTRLASDFVIPKIVRQ